jgi:peptidoglycan/LPS O-acetylase OafA/YrhL
MASASWWARGRQTFRSLITPSTKDVPIIDGLRGISILLIVLFHSFYGVLFILREFKPVLEFLNTIPPFFGFVTGSDKAVDIFFVVSSFLLGTSIFRKFEFNKQFSMYEIKKFYSKRLVRIYPLFILGIILYFPINIKQSLRNLPYNLFFIDNFDFRCIIPVGWSLSIEMQFYFLLPWLAKLLYFLKSQYRVPFLAFLCLMSIIGGIIVCLIYPEIHENHFYNFHPDKINPTSMMDRLYYPTHTRYGPLMLGLIWAYLNAHKEFHEKITFYFSSREYRQFLSIIFGLIVMYMMMFFPVYKPQSIYYKYFSPTLNLALHASHRIIFCSGLLMVIFPVFFTENKKSFLTKCTQRFLSLKFFRPFSQIVFPIYLFHFPMVALAGLAIFQTTKIKEIQNLAIDDVFKIFVLASIFSLLLGIILHIFIERPLIEKGYSRIDRTS